MPNHRIICGDVIPTLKAMPDEGVGTNGICLLCGREFEKKGQNHKYCDACKKEGRREREHDICKCGSIKRKESEVCRECYLKEKKNQIKRFCKICGTVFHIRKSYLKYDAGDYCSPECYQKSRIGKERPAHSAFLKNWWDSHPEQKEKARERAILKAGDKKWLDKMSKMFSGENNPNWKGGLSQTGYKNFYKTLKNKIRKRDNYTCVLCELSEKELGYTLSIHHIDYNKENSVEENLCSLCKRCNSLVNFERERWLKFFKEKIANIYQKNKRFNHPAPFPLELVGNGVLATTVENDLVFDPFMGRGTTIVEAERLKKNSIGVDASKQYCEDTYKRLKNEVEQTKLNGVPSTIEKEGF